VVTKIHHQLVGLSNQRSGRKSANLYEWLPFPGY
jgi:hypothetical protein